MSQNSQTKNKCDHHQQIALKQVLSHQIQREQNPIEYNLLDQFEDQRDASITIHTRKNIKGSKEKLYPPKLPPKHPNSLKNTNEMNSFETNSPKPNKSTRTKRIEEINSRTSWNNFDHSDPEEFTRKVSEEQIKKLQEELKLLEDSNHLQTLNELESQLKLHPCLFDQKQNKFHGQDQDEQCNDNMEGHQPHNFTFETHQMKPNIMNVQMTKSIIGIGGNESVDNSKLSTPRFQDQNLLDNQAHYSKPKIHNRWRAKQYHQESSSDEATQWKNYPEIPSIQLQPLQKIPYQSQSKQKHKIQIKTLNIQQEQITYSYKKSHSSKQSPIKKNQVRRAFTQTKQISAKKNEQAPKSRVSYKSESSGGQSRSRSRSIGSQSPQKPKFRNFFSCKQEQSTIVTPTKSSKGRENHKSGSKEYITEEGECNCDGEASSKSLFRLQSRLRREKQKQQQRVYEQNYQKVKNHQRRSKQNSQSDKLIQILEENQNIKKRAFQENKKLKKTTEKQVKFCYKIQEPVQNQFFQIYSKSDRKVQQQSRNNFQKITSNKEENFIGKQGKNFRKIDEFYLKEKLLSHPNRSSNQDDKNEYELQENQKDQKDLKQSPQKKPKREKNMIDEKKEQRWGKNNDAQMLSMEKFTKQKIKFPHVDINQSKLMEAVQNQLDQKNNQLQQQPQQEYDCNSVQNQALGIKKQRRNESLNFSLMQQLEKDDFYKEEVNIEQVALRVMEYQKRINRAIEQNNVQELKDLKQEIIKTKMSRQLHLQEQTFNIQLKRYARSRYGMDLSPNIVKEKWLIHLRNVFLNREKIQFCELHIMYYFQNLPQIKEPPKFIQNLTENPQFPAPYLEKPPHSSPLNQQSLKTESPPLSLNQPLQNQPQHELRSDLRQLLRFSLTQQSKQNSKTLENLNLSHQNEFSAQIKTTRKQSESLQLKLNRSAQQKYTKPKPQLNYALQNSKNNQKRKVHIQDRLINKYKKQNEDAHQITEQKLKKKINMTSDSCLSARQIICNLIRQSEDTYIQCLLKQLEGHMDQIQEGIKIARCERKVMSRNLKKAKTHIKFLGFGFSQSQHFIEGINEALPKQEIQYLQLYFKQSKQRSEQATKANQKFQLEDFVESYKHYIAKINENANTKSDSQIQSNKENPSQSQKEIRELTKQYANKSQQQVKQENMKQKEQPSQKQIKPRNLILDFQKYANQHRLQNKIPRQSTRFNDIQKNSSLPQEIPKTNRQQKKVPFTSRYSTVSRRQQKTENDSLLNCFTGQSDNFYSVSPDYHSKKITEFSHVHEPEDQNQNVKLTFRSESKPVQLRLQENRIIQQRFDSQISLARGVSPQVQLATKQQPQPMKCQSKSNRQKTQIAGQNQFANMRQKRQKTILQRENQLRSFNQDQQDYCRIILNQIPASNRLLQIIKTRSSNDQESLTNFMQYRSMYIYTYISICLKYYPNTINERIIQLEKRDSQISQAFRQSGISNSKSLDSEIENLFQNLKVFTQDSFHIDQFKEVASS